MWNVYVGVHNIFLVTTLNYLTISFRFLGPRHKLKSRKHIGKSLLNLGLVIFSQAKLRSRIFLTSFI